MIRNPFVPGSQNFRLLEALKHGPIYTQSRYDNPGLRFGYLSARIRDVNEHILSQGFSILKTVISTNNNEYRLVKTSEVAA